MRYFADLTAKTTTLSTTATYGHRFCGVRAMNIRDKAIKLLAEHMPAHRDNAPEWAIRAVIAALTPAPPPTREVFRVFNTPSGQAVFAIEPDNAGGYYIRATLDANFDFAERIESKFMLNDSSFEGATKALNEFTPEHVAKTSKEVADSVRAAFH